MNPVSNLSSAVSFQVSHSSIFRQVGEKFSWSWPVSGHGARSVETSKSDLLILLVTDVYNRCNSCNSCKRLRWLRTYHIHDRSWIWGMIIHLLLYHILYILLLLIIIINYYYYYDYYYYIHLSYPLIDSLEVWAVSRLWGDADLVDAFHWSFRLLAQLLVRTDQQTKAKNCGQVVFLSPWIFIYVLPL